MQDLASDMHTVEYSLVDCSVAPGFDFKDFTVLANLPDNERPSFFPETLQNKFL